MLHRVDDEYCTGNDFRRLQPNSNLRKLPFKAPKHAEIKVKDWEICSDAEVLVFTLGIKELREL